MKISSRREDKSRQNTQTLNNKMFGGKLHIRLFTLLSLLIAFGALNLSISAQITVTPATSPTAADNDYTRINNAVQTVASGGSITLDGTFDWTEANAAASWQAGTDGTVGTFDDFSILVPPNLNGVTFSAANLGDAAIQGPGDLPANDSAFEGVLYFDGTGTNQNWTISNIRFLDFDAALQMFPFNTTDFSGTNIMNNFIRVPADIIGGVSVDEPDFQNAALYFGFGTNQTISGNTIQFQGNGVSDSANGNFASSVGMQNTTSGGTIYDGLQITNNTMTVLNAQSADPEEILGIWENANAHTSNMIISGNSFTNQAAGNDPAVNQQRAFRITSHSSATTTVTYSNNRTEGANIGFQWLPPGFGASFAGLDPVQLISNTVINNATGILVQSQGVADANFNRIVGNSAVGLSNVDGVVNAENNWWGCNYGPGATGAGCTGTTNGVTGTVDFDPWLTLTTMANPDTVGVGATSTVTSRLTINSDGVDTSAMGSVPTTPASFVGMNGTVNPPTNPTTNGVTNTTFTATTAGMGGVNTTIDMQTVNAPITVLGPTAASVSIKGRVLNGKRGVSRAVVHITDQNGVSKTARTNQFGYYQFTDVEVGQTLIMNVFHKQYQFNPQVVTANEHIANLNFTAQ